MRSLTLALVVSCVAGCASKLEATTDRVDVNAAAGKKSGKFVSREGDEGGAGTRVDATEESEWQQFDFDTGEARSGERDWDIAFSRFRIKTNGGANGPGGVYVASLPGEDYDDVKQAPSEGFRADREDTEEDTDMDPDNVFNSGDEDWYDYNVMTHELSPKDIVYVIASTEEKFYKFVIDDYYDAAGTPAQFEFRWQEIDAPEGDWKPE